jgi:hypothetical protein
MKGTVPRVSLGSTALYLEGPKAEDWAEVGGLDEY